MPKVYKPKKVKRLKKHGFLVRMKKKTGARTISQRRSKGRKKLSV